MANSLADFLVKTVLDSEFRELALSDPVAAFEGYELTDEAQEILLSGDARMLPLLSLVLQQSWSESAAVAAPVPDPQPATPTTVGTHSLPEVLLQLSLVPRRVESAEGTFFIYEADLQPYPPAEGATAELRDGQVDMVVRIVPTIISAAGSEAKVAYAASIQPLAELAAPDPAEPARAMSGELAIENRAAAESLAASVRQSAGDDRYAKLLELARLLHEG